MIWSCSCLDEVRDSTLLLLPGENSPKTLEDVNLLDTLPMFGEANTMGIVIEEETK